MSISSGHAQSDSTSQEMPLIILKAMKIICDAVSSDVRHAGKFFTVAELPARYGTEWGNSLLEEVVSVLKEDLAEDQTGKEHPAEFLYNFTRSHLKYGEEAFSIRVKPIKEKPDVEGLQDTSVVVWWRCESTFNKIYVVVTKGGQESENAILIMRFSDHHVSSQCGATTPGNLNFFSIEKAVKACNRMSMEDTDYVLGKASPNTMAEIKQLENKVLRSFMVTTKCKLVK